MFVIEFISKKQCLNNISNTLENSIRCGQIVLGSYTEKFESILGYWNEHQYEAQWCNAISRLLNGTTKTALITSISDPSSANFINWWPCYLEGDIVVVQNQILFLNELQEPFDIVKMDKLITDRCGMDEDGNVISEWIIPLTEIRIFYDKEIKRERS